MNTYLCAVQIAVLLIQDALPQVVGLGSPSACIWGVACNAACSCIGICVGILLIR